MLSEEHGARERATWCAAQVVGATGREGWLALRFDEGAARRGQRLACLVSPDNHGTAWRFAFGARDSDSCDRASAMAADAAPIARVRHCLGREQPCRRRVGRDG